MVKIMKHRRYQKSLDRQEERVLPPRVEDYVSENNPVRAIDAYVDTLNLEDLGFKYTTFVVHAGQPPFNPVALLKLYLYGYIQHIHSSRKLAREAQRNLEVIWLMRGNHPCYKVISDFRKDNCTVIKSVNRDFIMLCKELSLFGGEEVAVDGSFFNGDTNKSRIYTKKNLNKQIGAIEKKITEYQKAIDEQDMTDDKAGYGALSEDEDLHKKLKRLQERQAEKKGLQKQLQDSGETQISMVDKEARLLTKRGQTIAGFNVQIAVDSKYHLIVANDVVQDGNDSQQLAPMLEKAQEILKSGNLAGLADTGYYNGTQLKLCEEQGIEAYVPIPKKSKEGQEEGKEPHFTSEDFTYDAEQDCYHCPQEKKITRYGRKLRHLRDKNYVSYKSKRAICNECPLRERCLTEKSNHKEILRWEHSEVYVRHQKRMETRPDNARQRGALVEHPFGTLKHRAGMHHFLMRGLEKCRGEFSLMVLGYNFTRVLNTLGVDALRDYCVQRTENELKNGQYA